MENIPQPLYEYKTLKIFNWLDVYLEHLPYFWWELINNQKVNYSSHSKWESNSRIWIFDTKSSSWYSNSQTTYNYYNELSLKRIKNNVPKDILEIENDFFVNIDLYLSDLSGYGTLNIFFAISFFFFLGYFGQVSKSESHFWDFISIIYFWVIIYLYYIRFNKIKEEKKIKTIIAPDKIKEYKKNIIFKYYK